MEAAILREASKYLKYPSSTFAMAYKRAINALVDDAEASTYVPSPGNEDAYEFLTAVIADIKQDEATIDEEEEIVTVLNLPDEEADEDDDSDDDFHIPENIDDEDDD